MRRLTFIFGILIFISACAPKNENAPSSTEIQDPSPDTIVGRKAITDELAGGAYRNRATQYFLIINGDTLHTDFTFAELKDSTISLYFHPAIKEPPLRTHRERMTILNLILREAAHDFRIDSLRSIGLQRLIYHGDLAVDISNTFLQQSSGSMDLENQSFSRFLMNTKLTTDFEGLLKPYGITVHSVSIEKLFWSSPDMLFRTSKLESDSTQIPRKIIDCITWLRTSKITKQQHETHN